MVYARRSPLRGRIRCTLAGLAVCLMPTASIAGQSPLDSWTVADGLPQGSVNDIAQTPDGYLWLATYGGLVRFDGLRFEVFDRSFEGVESLRTRALYVARDGTLWAGTDDGRLLRYRQGQFRTFGAEDGLEGDVALRIDEDVHGHLWITWINSVVEYDGQSFQRYRPEGLPHGVGPHLPAPGLATATALWWRALPAGVYCLRDGRVDQCLAADVVAPDRVRDLSSDEHGCLWVQTVDDVIHVSAPRRRAFDQSVRPGRVVPRSMFFHDDDVGAVWFASARGGLHRQKAPEEDGFDVEALTLFEDREGSIWLGTTGGLYRWRRSVVSTISTSDGLSSNNVYSLLRTRAGVIWIGSWGGGLNRWSDGAVTSLRASDGLPGDHITALFEDSDGRLLVGTSQGLAWIDGRRITPYPDPHALLSGPAWAIHRDRSNALWLGTTDGLVVERKGRVERYTTRDGLPDNGIHALLESRDGTLWIGTQRGIARYHDGGFTSLTERDGFIGNQVRALFEDQQGIVWAGTYDGGLYRIDGDRITRYTTRNGLFDNGVFQILPDDFGYFWIGSNRGISRVSQAELDDLAAGRATSVQATALGLRDGLPTLEANGGRQPSGLRMPDGTLWIPTQGGVVVIDPAAVSRNPHPPPVVIEAVLIGGEPVSSTATVEVPAHRTGVELRYTALSFIRPEQTRFRYRLAGLEDEWTDAGGRRTVTYHRLPAGRYRFEVIAGNSDGVWTETGAALAVVVHAPFFRQPWFLTSMGLVIAGAVVLAVRRRLAGLQVDRARQRAYGRQLLATQEQERRRIAHELHDSLGQDLFMIRTRAREFQQAVADAPVREVLEQIESMATDSYRGLKRIAWDLRPYQLDTLGLARTIEGMLNRASEASSVTFNAALDDLDDGLAPGAAIHVFRIVQEAVHNVVRHSGATRAQIVATRRHSTIELAVEDNGRGFDANREEDPAGFGLMGMRERALAIGGTLTIESSTAGTWIRLSVPRGEGPNG